MKTIFVSPEFPLNRRMRRAVRRGKLRVVREGGERLSLGGGMAVEARRAVRTFSSPLVCMADGGAEVGGGTGGGSDGNGDNSGGAQIPSGICTLAELLAGGVRLELPFYQREYTWGVKQCNELWEDIRRAKERCGKHYMGSVTLESLPSPPGGYRIIDGQQRLASLCLMAGACVRKLRGAVNAPAGGEDQARADEIARLFLVNGDNPRNGDDMKVRMLNLDGHYDHDYFRELTLGQGIIPDGQNPTQRKLRAALNRFSIRFGALGSESRFEFMRAYAGDGLLFTRVVIPPELEGHRVYATLNFRGEHLTAAHVIKAHLLANVSEGEVKSCSKRWADLLKKVGEVGNDRMVEFLRHAFNARFKIRAKSVGDAELPEAVKVVVPDKISVMSYLDDLDKKADFFMKLRRPLPSEWARANFPSAAFLKPYEALTPMLMSAHERFSAEDFSRVLWMCEVVMLRRSMVGLKAGPMAHFAWDSAIKIHGEEHGGGIRNYAELRRHFNVSDLGMNLYPTDDEFGLGILRNFPKAKAPRKHCLARMEQYLSGGGYPGDIKDSHAMPLLTRDDLRELGLPAALGGNLANLVLWEHGNEAEFAAVSYSQRVEALRTSQHRLSQETAERWPEKTGDMLLTRGEWMGELAVKTWNLDRFNE